MAPDETSDETEPKTKYAVGLEHLFWVEADDEEEAIKKGIQKVADLDEDEVRRLDFGVFDQDEF